MKTIFLLALVALAIILTSCATQPPPPQAFHNTDNNALVIASLDDTDLPDAPTNSLQAGRKTRWFWQKPWRCPQHQAAVVILENYTEPQIGDQFRDRGTALFVGLRNLGYQHIVFLQGNGVANPEGLMTLAEYN